METNVIIVISVIALVLILAGGAVYWLYFSSSAKGSGIGNLMSAGTDADGSFVATKGKSSSKNLTPKEMQDLNKQLAKKKKGNKEVVTEETKFFRAGFFTVEDRQTFYRIKILAPIILATAFGVAGYFVSDLTTAISGMVLGLLIGAQMPQSYIDRKIKRRNEDIMFYLPLVIEQIVIGVSSSLDTGPCIQRVISMADERNSHNPVTELLRHAHQYAKSGISLEEAMADVGSLSGHPELKHAFKSLGQVAKHGGEITKQLQELADSVSSQRETMIEGKIKRLELEATGPVGLVFFGFMIIFLSGLGVQVMKAFQ